MPFCDSLTRFRVFKRTGPLPAAPAGWEWPDLMRIALGEAGDASQNGDVPVGALIVAPGGRILARAANGVERLHDPTAHAEIRAIRKAASIQGSSQLCDCVLVVTLEPCLMCAGACAHARLAGIVYGAYDSRAGAVASCVDLPDLPLAGRTLWHMGGVMGKECAELLQDFFARRR